MDWVRFERKYPTERELGKISPCVGDKTCRGPPDQSC
jgi:hypothetical protein